MLQLLTQARIEGLAIGLATIWLDDLLWLLLRALGLLRRRVRQRKGEPTDEWEMVQ